MDKVYLKSRYDKGEAAYLNCPMTEEEFNRFYDAVLEAEVAPTNEFEKEKYFEGCMPFEVMAERGRKTLLFGPMKPVGLEDPKQVNVHLLSFNYDKMMQLERYIILLVSNSFKMGRSKEKSFALSLV